jgi:hypothetical protein
VDDFGVKYVGKEHAEHLLKVLQEHYKVTTDWKGNISAFTCTGTTTTIRSIYSCLDMSKKP